ncbi:MAG: hypothetical protein AAF564_15510 [Bacteroidota bacterium]
MEEEIIVPLIVFSFIALIVKMSLDFAKWKKTHNSQSLGAASDKSLGVSELKNLISEAVMQANIPLNDRIAELEDQLEMSRKSLPEKEPLKQLSSPEPGDD